MDNTKISRLINALSRKTEEGAITWEPTEKADTFQTAFAAATVRISKERNADIRVSVYNEAGQLVDTATDVDLKDSDSILPSPYYVLGNLLNRARRQAMGVDATLDALLQELGEPPTTP